jgi:uncharacterized DUF497 family protein
MTLLVTIFPRYIICFIGLLVGISAFAENYTPVIREQHKIIVDHSITEDRYITFGVSDRCRLLVVAHTEEDETIRIISARLASKGERKIYEEG